MVEPVPARRWRPSALLTLSAALHASGVAALAANPAAWPLVASALLLDHLVLSAAGMSPRGRLLGPNRSRLPPASARQSRIALTFDDGPDPRVTPRVLDLLEEHGATATFFFIGCKTDQHPEIVAETVGRGHGVGNHTYHHTHAFAFFGPRRQGREIDRAQESLERAGARRPVLFRAPAGMRNLWLDPVLARRGLTLVSWTRRGYDTVDPEPERVTRRLVKGLAAGDVVLLHDGNGARDRQGRPVVLEALPRLLDTMAERGLRPTSLVAPESHPEPR